LLKQLALHSACLNKKSELINIFQVILNKFNKDRLDELLNILDKSKRTVLQIAIENNHMKIIDELLSLMSSSEIFRKKDINGNLPIHYAAKLGTIELFELLKKYDMISFDSNEQNDTALHIATINNRFLFMKILINFEKSYLIREEKKNDLIPMYKRSNKMNYTPLQLGLIMSNEKCVEELINSSDCNLNETCCNNESIYHLCVINSNLESLRFLLNKKLDRFMEPLFFKTIKENETPIHIACRTGQLEAIKLILINLTDSRFSNSIDYYLKERNYNGQTCFHLACHHGYFNIIEYFLKDLKKKSFLELKDNSSNTCLINSTKEGHLKICQILLEYGANINAIDNQSKNSLQYSCELKYFEISKLLIKNYNEEILKCKNGIHPIFLAVFDGAHEVLHLLLEKKVHIDLLDDNNENCLDIAIKKEQIQCIKTLLNNENWFRLFNNQNNSKFKENQENRQLAALFNKKMWNIIEMILDKCVLKGNKEKSYDFRVIDPQEFQSIKKHPLMLLTNSGQEKLLMHEITQVLLKLKWRFLPRLVFYSNITMHIIFLILLVNHAAEISDMNKIQVPKIKKIKIDTECISTNFKIPLIVICFIILVKNLLQFILIDGLVFFLAFETWLEISAITFTFMSMNIDSFIAKTTYCSIGLMNAFLNFAFLIEPIRIFGLYVLALRRTIINSAKFFPVFIIIYLGFVLSFKTRRSSNISYFNDTNSALMIKGLTMMLGDFRTDQMGLNYSYVNYILYLLFIILISIIILNLFVGIAVGEVSTVLAEATVQQISIRIMLVLKLQYALKSIYKIKFLNQIIGLTFSSYNYQQDETVFSKKIDYYLNIFIKKLFKKESGINLIDPNTRLEEKLSLLYLKTDLDCKEIKSTMANQLYDVELKFNSSYQRLEDYLVEMSRKSLNNFESTKDDSSTKLDLVETNLIKSQSKIYNFLNDFRKLNIEKLNSLKQSFSSIIHNLELSGNRIYSNLNELFNKLDNKTNLLKESIENIDFIQKIDNGIFKHNFEMTNGRLNVLQIELERLVNLFDSVEAKLNVHDHKLNIIDILVRRETFSSKLDLCIKKIDDLTDRQFNVERILNEIKN